MGLTTAAKIISYICSGFSVLFYTLFLFLIFFYCIKETDKNVTFFCKIHILIFSLIVSICNLSGIPLINNISQNFRIICKIQSFFRLMSQVGLNGSFNYIIQ